MNTTTRTPNTTLAHAAASHGDYTSAPACTMLATHCAACGRALLDAVSVETGMGPICRDRYGYDTAQGEADWAEVQAALAGTPMAAEIEALGGDAHKAANKLVHRIACDQMNEEAPRYVTALRALGFATLAGRIALRAHAVVITEEGGLLVVRAPKCDAFIAALHAGRVRAQWDGEAFCRRAPLSERAKLWAAICKGFPKGTLVMGTKRAVVLLAKLFLPKP